MDSWIGWEARSIRKTWVSQNGVSIHRWMTGVGIHVNTLPWSTYDHLNKVNITFKRVFHYIWTFRQNLVLKNVNYPFKVSISITVKWKIGLWKWQYWVWKVCFFIPIVCFFTNYKPYKVFFLNALLFELKKWNFNLKLWILI